MFIFLIGLLSLLITLIGGYFALYFKDKLHLILGYSAGAVMGVALFDLIPEAISLGYVQNASGQIDSVFNSDITMSTMLLVGIGFLLYLFLDRILPMHSHDETDDLNLSASHEHGKVHKHVNLQARSKTSLATYSTILHSLMDGLAIGFAFQVGEKVGIAVAVAILLHNFSDGINTINLSFLNSSSIKLAKRRLLLSAAMPMLGIILSRFIVLDAGGLSTMLAIFAGFFLYIGASELIPESQHRHPYFWTTFMTMFGMFTLYFLISFISI